MKRACICNLANRVPVGKEWGIAENKAGWISMEEQPTTSLISIGTTSGTVQSEVIWDLSDSRHISVLIRFFRM